MYECISKMWHIHTMQYYLTIKGNEVLTHATTWVNLENIVLSEKKARYKRSHFVWFHLYEIYMKCPQ